MKNYHKNPRQIKDKQFANLRAWLLELGDLSGIVHDLNTDEVISGNQRMRAIDIARCEIVLMDGPHDPDAQGTVAHGYVLWQGAKYNYRQVRWTPEQCEKANIVANKAGGSWDFDILANEWEKDDLLEWGFEDFEFGIVADEDMLGVAKDAKPNPRNLPIDAIFTGGFTAGCCLAVASGFKYGIQSSDKVCPRAAPSNNHKTYFVDNDYFKYDHTTHLRFVAEQRPKYATVRDIMTKAQCQEAGIEFFELAQILDWAEELAQYTDNVIVIPKYDCFDQIPDKFVLGYSVPTSHGGTPLPTEAFKGRPVHLLGGSWPDQMAHMAALSDDVVSFDNNHIARLADFGSFIDMEGSSTDLYKSGYGYVANPKYVALALSLGAIAAKVNELYAGSATPAE